MSDIVTLRCTTVIDDRKAESTIAVPRAVWDELPEDVREMEHARVRAMHAQHLQEAQGLSVAPGSLVVTVDGAGLVRPDEEPT